MSRFNNANRLDLYMRLVELNGEICRGGYSANCTKVPHQPGSLEIDHIDGSENHNCLSNLQLLCHACNVKKGMSLTKGKRASHDLDTSWLSQPLCEREREREKPSTIFSGNGANDAGTSAAAEQSPASPTSSLQVPVCERESAGSDVGTGKAAGPCQRADAKTGDFARKLGRPIRSKDAYDVMRQQSETSSQRANKKREWRFVDFAVDLIMKDVKVRPIDLINAAAHEFGGSPVAHARYWDKVSNPINGIFSVDHDAGGNEFVVWKGEAQARERYEFGECVFCGSKRNQGKGLCDSCIDKYRQSE